MYNKFVVVDLETTGNSPKKGDRIIQFAAVVIVNGKVVDRFSSLINPNIKIPVFIEELTGINNDMIKDSPSFEGLAERIQLLIQDAYFVAHNVLFDLSFLQEELLNANQEGFFGSVIDTVEMARFLFPTIDSYKLNDLANQLGFTHDRPHQADSDAEVTAELFLHFLNKLESLPLTTCRQLSELSGGLKSDIHLLFEDMLDGKDTEYKDLSSHLENVNGLIIRKTNSFSDGTSEKTEISFPFSDKEKEKIMANAFHSFQKRDGQFLMMNEVVEAFSNQQHLVVEAGTGIGKSLGYLLPAAYFAKQTGEKILISTYTTQLQSQLITNDVPLLKKILPFEINITLLKGKTHYLSLPKFEESLHDDEDNYDSSLTKMQILIWLLETDTGDVDELNLSSGGQIYWNRIKQSEKVSRGNELWQEKDFYQRAKQRIKGANLIITNHSLLLADSAHAKEIIPSIQYLVIDEGHHFQKVALKYFGDQLDYFQTRLLFNQFGLKEQKQLLFKLEKWFDSTKWYILDFHKLYGTLSDLFFEMDEFFKAVRIYVKNATANEPLFKISKKLKRRESEYQFLYVSAERFAFKIRDFLELIEILVNYLVKINHSIDELSESFIALEQLRSNIHRMFLNPDTADIAWIEIDFRSYQNATTIYLQPVTVAEQLKSLFFTNNKTVILTSATLTVENQFEYILKELGLGFSTKTMSIPSTFDYMNKVQVFIPKDIPDITTVSLEEYVAAISEQIISIAEVTKGRVLILFTSHEMLRKTYLLMKESGLLEDFALIAQGISSGSRSRLVRNFQRFDKAILFGTSSFWEGIDIPGEDLSCLVMVRLPFTPLDDPAMEARCEEIRKQGGNPFLEVSLPEAVLRFKQGFGRLIRTEHDKGVLIILDRRIVSAKYGRAFINSIPKVNVRQLNLEETLTRIDKWLL
jgi:ATP-dependent DNA helicase DinG